MTTLNSLLEMRVRLLRLGNIMKCVKKKHIECKILTEENGNGFLTIEPQSPIAKILIDLSGNQLFCTYRVSCKLTCSHCQHKHKRNSNYNCSYRFIVFITEILQTGKTISIVQIVTLDITIIKSQTT